MVAVYNCETRMDSSFYYEEPGTAGVVNWDKYFPATNYVMRPLQWDPTTRRTTNFSDHTGNILPAYDIDYPDEYDWWEFGGFRYRPFDNIDYRHENNNIYTSNASKSSRFNELG